MRLVYSRDARSDLTGIFDYIAADRRRAAEEVVLKIEQTALLMALFPAIGRMGRIEGAREFSVPSLPYIIVYRIEPGLVRVLRVLHARRRWPDR